MRNVENAVKDILIRYGFTKHINKVPDYFARNFEYLLESQWDLEHEISHSSDHELTKYEERELAV
jgi:hypothetical protein